MQDPGWVGAWRGILFVPPLGFFISRRLERGLSRLAGLRLSFVREVAVVAIWGSLWALVADSDPRSDRGAWLGVVGIVGLIGILLTVLLFGRTNWFIRPPTPKALAQKYRSRFFTAIALALLTFFAGLFVSIMRDDLMALLVGGALSVPILGIAAPTRHNVARAERQALAQGAGSSLLEGLLERPEH